ncbi:MAG: hypothetical protein HKN70_09455 [Gammaproteobacteria bacterium]|nr:hypothetical protein [Gammaproteobacteria bacterium]
MLIYAHKPVQGRPCPDAGHHTTVKQKLETIRGNMEQAIWTSNSALFDEHDPPPFTIMNPDSDLPLLLVADHASNRIPARLGDLGLDQDTLLRHIAYDRGTEALTMQIAERVGCRAVLCNYSRLVVDCNRHLHDGTAILEVSDLTRIPGNENLSDAQREARIAGIYAAYHQAIEQTLNQLQQIVAAPALLAVHSFTPRLKMGDARPWHVGVLWDKDERIATRLLAHLRQNPDLHVGDNQPYSGKHPADYTIDTHGEARGLPCASIEIRKDLLADEGMVDQWAQRLIGFAQSLITEPEIFAEIRSE